MTQYPKTYVHPSLRKVKKHGLSGLNYTSRKKRHIHKKFNTTNQSTNLSSTPLNKRNKQVLKKGTFRNTIHFDNKKSYKVRKATRRTKWDKKGTKEDLRKGSWRTP